MADAKDGDWESGHAAPQLPGVDWAYWNNGREGVGEEWWARAAEQRQPLVMRTSEQFYSTLERYALRTCASKMVLIVGNRGLTAAPH